jgi:hypothetical protein
MTVDHEGARPKRIGKWSCLVYDEFLEFSEQLHDEHETGISCHGPEPSRNIATA